MIIRCKVTMIKSEEAEFYYRVETYSLGQICCSCDGEYAYPKYHIIRSDLYIFKTWSDVMAYIKSKAAEDAEYREIHHFRLRREAFGPVRCSDERLWLFDSKGNQFNGMNSFSFGDLVETINIDLKEQYVSLGIVVGKKQNGYLIANKPNAQAVSVAAHNIMPLRFPVSDNLKVYFKNCHDTVVESKIPAALEPFKYGFDMGCFGQLNVCIDVDPETLTPHLHIVNRNCRFVVNLRIDRPEYFDKPKHSDCLQPYQIRELVEYLNENIYGKTRWWYMLRRFWEWHDDYNLNIPLDFPLPDYTELINRDHRLGR